MATEQEWTQISDLVGEIRFGLGGGTPGKDDYVPQTEGFIIRVTYGSQTEKTKAALSCTVIAVRSIMKAFYRKNKRFPFAQGKVQAVNGKGQFTMPMSSHVDKLEAQLTTGQVEMADKIRLAKSLGLAVPQEWLDQVEATETVPVDDDEQSDENALKYPKGSLDKVVIAKLRIIAQNEELEGYDDLTADELREELYTIEK